MNFVPNMTGTLIRVEEDAHSRFRFEIWFDYTKRAMNLISDGAMLAVPNFASNSRTQHFSILEVVSILPMHYALGDDTRGYPGFVVEAAKNIVNDWEEQENESTEDTTKIRCIAIPTNLEFVQALRSMDQSQDVHTKLQEESKLPMLGAEARLLDTPSTEFIANYGIGRNENTVKAGVLQRDDEVTIKIRVEELLRTHFGIFGFTGAGKSNLLSTLITRVLTENSEKAKVVFFDLMGEYTALLIDQLLRTDIDAYLICLGDNTLPLSVLQHINNDERASLSTAVRDFARYTLLPKALKPHAGSMAGALEQLLKMERVKVFSPIENMNLHYVFFDGANNLHSPSKYQDRRGAVFTRRNEALKAFVRSQGGTNTKVTKQVAQNVLNALQKEIEDGGTLHEFEKDMGGVMTLLTQAIPKLEQQQPSAVSFNEIIDLLNNKDRSSLILFNSHDPNELRKFAKQLGDKAYDSRRRSGEIEPLVSFVFDEADEFIPREAPHESYRASAEIATTLARRGRKFGLGIGIATQRVRYLDTSIMAQPHTYFVSKMPRSSDRQVVAEAFGVSEDMFRQTFKFKKGDWLLMSYDATGLEAIPLPIHSDDANQRIKNFLVKQGGKSEL